MSRTAAHPPATANEYSRWEDVPANLKTKSSLKQMGLKLKRGQQPVAIKTHWDYKIPDYNLYEVSEAVPNVVSDKQREAAAKAQQKSLEARTCTNCGWVEDLSRHYKGKQYISGGLCPYCREDQERESDRNEAIEWARQILQRSDVLILDTETTDLDGEVIELAIINLKGETVYSQRFNPTRDISAGAQAVHGLTNEVLVNEPRFAQCAPELFQLLTAAGLVLIYNSAFDINRLAYTSALHGVDMPAFKSDCLMEWYAQFVNEWSSYHQSYRWLPLNGGHDALGDCRAALDVLKEMAALEAQQPASADG